jgi:uncharacterized protein YkwD
MGRSLRLAAAAALLATFVALPTAAQPEAPERPTSFGGADAVAALSAEELSLYEDVREAMVSRGTAPCLATARLTEAARAHARSLVAAGTSHRIEPAVVRRELLRVGAVDPVVVPWAVASRGQLDFVGRRERLAERYGGERPPTHCGVGVAEGAGRSVAVVVGVRRHVEIEPFPAHAARGDRARLEGRLGADYRSPVVMITTPRGEVSSHQTLRRAGRFGAWVDFPLPGRYVVEVMAAGRQGPEVVALFPVFVDTEPSLADAEPPRQAGAVDAPRRSDPAAELLERLNGERRRAGLAPLLADEHLADVARAHTRDMVERRFFGHVSPAGVDLTGRLERAGLGTDRAAENLVRGSSSARAHAQLMESPSHRANLLDPDVTHVGIGVVERDGELLVTQIFVAW